ncbi:hypothetical protein ACIP79_38550 [Streptomyces sp. NPDC088747]|uniref:hypothetical protein n=1 Tax=Streptomyces sp. NPDC088747 TaxID=3365886 RepID=UPI0038043F96
MTVGRPAIAGWSESLGDGHDGSIPTASIRWTDSDGVPRAAGVSYDKASADDRRT